MLPLTILTDDTVRVTQSYPEILQMNTNEQSVVVTVCVSL